MSLQERPHFSRPKTRRLSSLCRNFSPRLGIDFFTLKVTCGNISGYAKKGDDVIIFFSSSGITRGDVLLSDFVVFVETGDGQGMFINLKTFKNTTIFSFHLNESLFLKSYKIEAATWKHRNTYFVSEWKISFQYLPSSFLFSMHAHLRFKS